MTYSIGIGCLLSDINNAEGKHHGFACSCLTVGQFIDPATGSISGKTQLNYSHFAEHRIISSNKSDWPSNHIFIDDLKDVVTGRVKCHTLNKCPTIEVFYITSVPKTIHCNLVLSALITLSEQISDAKLASN